MAGSLNKVMLIGNLGRDPEVRTMGSGDRVVSFSLACTESWRDKNSGEKKEKTEWVNVVCFNDGLIKVIEQYVKKGSKIFVEGQFQTRKYADKDGGKDRYATEVVIQRFGGQLILLGDAGGGRGGGDGGDDRYSSQQRGGGSSGYGGARTGGGGGTERESFPADLDDEIPF